jgi:hypothetical protein
VAEHGPDIVTWDIALERGRELAGTIVGPDGEAVGGVLACGLSPNARSGEPTRLRSGDFKVTGVNPRKTRVLFFYEPQKKLSRLVFVNGSAPGPIAVRLEPTGAISGRVLDGDGRPRRGLRALAQLRQFEQAPDQDAPLEILFGGNPPPRQTTTQTDEDGRFRVEGLAPGLPYELFISEAPVGDRAVGVYHKEPLSVEPGRTLDLGELKGKSTGTNK